MIKSKSNVDDCIKNERNRFHHAEGKGNKTKKHRYERRKVKEVLHQIFPGEEEEATT